MTDDHPHHTTTEGRLAARPYVPTGQDVPTYPAVVGRGELPTIAHRLGLSGPCCRDATVVQFIERKLGPVEVVD